MNFTPFGVPFSGSLPTQFAAAKFTQNITTANGQVVGVLSGGEGGVHYLRPVDGSGFATPAQSNQQTVITLPITMPGAKPGDPQQTVQIQVVPAPPVTQSNSVQSPKYHISQIPIQTFQQGTTVLTVAYSPQGQNAEGVQLQVGDQQGIPEGMTVVAAIQPQDLQLIQAAQPQNSGRDDDKKDIHPVALIKSENLKNDNAENSDFITQPGTSNIPTTWQSITTSGVADYIRLPNALPMSIQQFLKFSAESIKRESQVENSPLSESLGETSVESQPAEVDTGGLIVADIVEQEQETEEGDKPKKKKKNKKKPPKPRRPKPGQVHIATALDGTTLFCCPECHMAYPEKELLEQHLVGHKIERRFICDICGAGLKRKEHLERHKLGHNPERPFVCSVCMKGFKRKEHLNLHYVIHSGEKNEVCEECGKGFYRKDHLRKHARSHMARRLKEEMNQQHQGGSQTTTTTTSSGAQQVTIQVQVPTTNIQVPVQIQVPQHHLVNNNDDDHQSLNLPTMNFSPFGGHFPASIPTIHQFAAKFTHEGSSSTLCPSQESSNTRYGSNSVPTFSQHHGGPQQHLMTPGKYQGGYVNQTNAYSQHSVGRVDKRGYDQQQELAQELCAAMLHEKQGTSQQNSEKVKQEREQQEERHHQQSQSQNQSQTQSQNQPQSQNTTTSMPSTWQSLATPGSTVADYLSHLPASTLPLSLHHFLKYSAENIKKETAQQLNINNSTPDPNINLQNLVNNQNQNAVTPKKKKKKKAAKEKKPRPKPGEIRLTTALDGSTLYCCPECHMAYPEKELLEQHLVGHTLERRFVCDICGAGLKRKDHLTRHKQSHNPERPYVCTVCLKAFKRKEQLTLHFVIHSGEKRHICPECGKGFYRKDHLRKHTRSHIARRVKAELSQQGNTTPGLQGPVAAPGPPATTVAQALLS